MPRLPDFLRHRWARRIGIAIAVVIVGAYALFWALLFNPLEGSFDGELTDLAPADTILALHVRDLGSRWRSVRDSGSLEDFERSGRLEKFLDSELWLGLGGGELMEMLESMGQGEGGAEVLTEENALDLLGREFLVFAAPTGGRAIGFGLVTRIPFRMKLYEAAFERFGRMAVPEGAFEERYRGAGLPGYGVWVGRARDCLVLSTDPALLDEAMDRAYEGAGESLAAFWSGAEDDGTGDPAIYADFQRFVRSEFQETIDALTEGRVGGFLRDVYEDLFPKQATGAIRGRAFHPHDDLTRIGVELVGHQNPIRFEPGRRRIRALDPRPFQIEKSLPRSSVLVTMRRVDAPEYLEWVLSEQGEAFRESWDQFVLQIGQALGRPGFFQDEFLPALGGEVAFVMSKVDYAAEAEPGEKPPLDWFPALSLVLSLSDVEAVRPLFEAAMRQHDMWGVKPGSVLVREIEGVRCYDWSDNPFKEEQQGRTMRPAMAIVGDLLVLTTHRAALRDLVRVQRGEAQALGTSERYVRALDGGALAADLLLYVDFQGMLDVASGIVPWQAEQNALNWQLENPEILRSVDLESAEAMVEDRKREEADLLRRDIEACRLLDLFAVRAHFDPRKVECEARFGVELGPRRR